MKHTVSHEAKRVPVRWGFVAKVVLAVSLPAFAAYAAWCLAAFAVPQYENAKLMQEFDELELRDLSNRMLRIETVLHLR